MAKKLCKDGQNIIKKDKKIKYSCKKCGMQSNKEKHCCKPQKLKKSA